MKIPDYLDMTTVVRNGCDLCFIHVFSPLVSPERFSLFPDKDSLTLIWDRVVECFKTIDSSHKRSGMPEEGPEVVPEEAEETTLQRAQRLDKIKRSRYRLEKLRKEKLALEKKMRGMIFRRGYLSTVFLLESSR